MPSSASAPASRRCRRVASRLAALAAVVPASLVAAQAPGVDAPAAPPAAQDALPPIDFVLVKLAPGAAAFRRDDGSLSLRLDGEEAPGARAVMASIGARSVERAASVAHANAERAARLGLDRWIKVRLEPGRDPAAGAAALSRIPGVEVAEVDGVGGLADLVPNDPSFPSQWALMNTGQTVGGLAGASGADVHAPAAWSISTGGGELIVGVIDGGVAQHADLAGRILPGWNVPDGNDDTSDGCSSHGTHVSGIIAALGNNGSTVAGLCWDAKILPVVIVDPCSGLESWLADGITWAVDHGAQVLNLSVQFSQGTQYLHDAVLYAADAGVPMIAATGNSNQTPPSFPARWPETIAVAATNNLDQRWASSNYGPEVDVAAPGVNVLSLSSTGGTLLKTGTSMAAPHVTGITALMLGVAPGLTAEELRVLLQQSADDLAPAGFDDFTGWGRVNAHAALLAALDAAAVPGDLTGDGVVDGSDLGSLLGYWGPCPDCDDCPADFDGDCVVNGGDLGSLLGWWSTS